MIAPQGINQITINRIATLNRIRTRRHVAKISRYRRSHHINLNTHVKLRINMITIRRNLSPLSNRPLNRVSMFATTMVALTKMTFNMLINGRHTLNFRRRQTNVIFQNSRLSVIFLTVLFTIGQFVRLEIRDIRNRYQIMRIRDILNRRFGQQIATDT